MNLTGKVGTSLFESGAENDDCVLLAGCKVPELSLFRDAHQEFRRIERLSPHCSVLRPNLKIRLKHRQWGVLGPPNRGPRRRRASEH